MQSGGGQVVQKGDPWVSGLFLETLGFFGILVSVPYIYKGISNIHRYIYMNNAPTLILLKIMLLMGSIVKKLEHIIM